MIALTVAAALAASPLPDTTDESTRTLARLQAMYQQSCSVRAYGAFDDVCGALRKQMKEAEKRHKRAAAQARARSRVANQD